METWSFWGKALTPSVASRHADAPSPLSALQTSPHTVGSHPHRWSLMLERLRREDGHLIRLAAGKNLPRWGRLLKRHLLLIDGALLHRQCPRDAVWFLLTRFFPPSLPQRGRGTAARWMRRLLYKKVPPFNKTSPAFSPKCFSISSHTV